MTVRHSPGSRFRRTRRRTRPESAHPTASSIASRLSTGHHAVVGDEVLHNQDLRATRSLHSGEQRQGETVPLALAYRWRVVFFVNVVQQDQAGSHVVKFDAAGLHVEAERGPLRRPSSVARRLRRQPCAVPNLLTPFVARPGNRLMTPLAVKRPSIPAVGARLRFLACQRRSGRTVRPQCQPARAASPRITTSNTTVQGDKRRFFRGRQ